MVRGEEERGDFAESEVVFWRWDTGADILPQTCKAVLFSPQKEKDTTNKKEGKQIPLHATAPNSDKAEKKIERTKEEVRESRASERLQEQESERLSKAELLAIVLGAGNASEEMVEMCADVLANYGNSFSNLSKASVDLLSRENGIGDERARIISAAMEIAKRRVEEKAEEIKKVITSKDIFAQFRFLGNKAHEEVWVLFMSGTLRIKGKKQVSMGSTDRSLLITKDVLKTVLMSGCENFCIVHNHPGYSDKPSSQDLESTLSILRAAKIMGIELTDHIIVYGMGERDYYSMQDRGDLKKMKDILWPPK